ADFRVTGTNAFSIGTFMYGAQWADPTTLPPNQKGDPSSSVAIAVEQYRNRYIFLAPDDYDTSYVDVVLPEGTTLTLDGAPASGTVKPIGSTGFGVSR